MATPKRCDGNLDSSRLLFMESAGILDKKAAFWARLRSHWNTILCVKRLGLCKLFPGTVGRPTQ